MTRLIAIPFPSTLAALLLAAGCVAPSAGTPSVGQTQDDLTSTATEPADISSASIEVADDDMSASASTSFEFARLGRPEIGVVVRALAAGVRLCANQETIETTTKTASCSAIGNNGQYRGGATIIFNHCVLPWGGRLDGTIVVDVTKDLAPGQSCSADAMIDVSHTVTVTDLVHVRPSGVSVQYPSATAHSSATRPIGQAPRSLNLEVAGERKVSGPRGALLLDHQFSATATVSFQEATATSAPAIELSASATIEHLLAHYTATITVDSLVRTATCCLPVSGTVELLRTGSIDDSHEVSFGPACGQFSVDGHAISIPECL